MTKSEQERDVESLVELFSEFAEDLPLLPLDSEAYFEAIGVKLSESLRSKNIPEEKCENALKWIVGLNSSYQRALRDFEDVRVKPPPPTFEFKVKKKQKQIPQPELINITKG